MGCKCSKVAPVIEPNPIKDPVRVTTNDPTKQLIQNPNGSARNPTTNSNDKDILDDDQLIRSLINAQNSTTIGAFVEIEVADSYAFNKSFIQQRQQAIDNRSYRLTIESWRPKSLQQLVNAIKSLSNNKSLIDCHWFIFYWITYNIEYDTVSYFSKNYADQTAEGVFRTKKGVCAGYANIYKYICDQLNIPCDIISGYSKGYGFDDRESAPTQTDHAWNAVEINHHWYLMESTWGAGHLTNQKLFERQLDTYYFFPCPNEMIYHHLPQIEKWQLLRKPIQMKQYLQMPKIHPSYFQLNLALISPRHQAYVELLPGKPYALVLIRAPSDVYLIASIKLHGREIEGGHRIMFDRNNRLYRCYFAPNAVGKYKITIFGKRGDTDKGSYNGAIDLTLDIKQIPINRISFPKTWKKFFDFNLNVVSPKNTHLIKVHNGTTHAEILIETPDNVELLGRLTNTTGEKIKNGHQVFYDRHKDLWRCKFAPNCNGIFDAEILAKKKSDTGSYTSAVTFKIDAKHIPTSPLSYPTTWQSFHDLDLKIESPQNRAAAVWSDNASFSEIRISAPDDVQLSCNIQFNGKKEENCGLAQFDHKKQQWQLLFAPQRTGLHKLVIFAGRKSGTQISSSSVVEFDLNVTKLRKTIKFPTVYSIFQTNKYEIYEPINGVLKKGSIVPIHCFIPGATTVDLQVDSKWIETKGYEDPILKTKVTVGSHDVIIYAKYGQSASYNALLRYSVA